MFNTPTNIFLSNRAYLDILNETSQHLGTETGGVLIGECRQNKWFVVESIDPGPKAVLQHSYFEYDQGYVNHLSNKVRRRYVASLRLLGLWHRHPGSFDSFSGTDDGTHRRYIQQCDGLIISGLVNIDPTFRITFYIVDGEPPRHQKTAYAVGDEHFPPDLLQAVDDGTLMSRVNGAGDLSSKAVQEMRIIDKSPTPLSMLNTIINPIRDRFGAQDRPAPSSDIRESPQEPDPVAREALDMLDEELEFLDSQRDFEYELEMSARGVLLTMQKLSRLRGNNGDHVRFLFTVEDQRRIVKQGNLSYPFRKGIVEEVIGQLFY